MPEIQMPRTSKKEDDNDKYIKLGLAGLQAYGTYSKAQADSASARRLKMLEQKNMGDEVSK